MARHRRRALDGTALVARAAAALLAVGLVACEHMVTEPPSSVCTTLGAQCQLERGPLGVCESATCTPGATPPCFTCVSQH